MTRKPKPPQPAPRRPGGRPPAGDRAMLSPITIRFPTPMMQQIEEIMAARLDSPDKGAIVRELVAEALDARAKRKGK